MPWVKLPFEGFVESLEAFRWRSDPELSPARDTAALMIYVVFMFVRQEHEANGVPMSFASITYDELETATGLSRSLIRQGIDRLTELALVRPMGSRQKREYQIDPITGQFIKLPCRAVFKQGEVAPFKALTLRSKHELHALKLYLYLAAVRDRSKFYSVSSYETIHHRLKIPERDIRRAINVLNACGLTHQVDRLKDEGKPYGPNLYYLAGYKDFSV